MANITILGAGSWGTAIAISLASSGHNVLLWARNVEHAANMQNERCNIRYLPGISFPNTLQITSDFVKAMACVNDIIVAVPSRAFQDTVRRMQKYYQHGQRIVWATKGFDEQNRLLHHTVLSHLGDGIPMAVIAGPSFAKEVAEGLPTAITIAATQLSFAQELASLFSQPMMRVYPGEDIVGAELGGAVKNVIAIAAGISDGLGFGANARAALITRGLAEMLRLGSELNAKPETLIGLAGLGDLILTCTDNKSRNRRFGLLMGKGLTREQSLQEIGQVVEGVVTAAHVLNLARDFNVDMPISEQVYGVISGACTPEQAVKLLLTRSVKIE